MVLTAVGVAAVEWKDLYSFWIATGCLFFVEQILAEEGTALCSPNLMGTAEQGLRALSLVLA